MDGTNYHMVRRHVDVRRDGTARVSVSFCPDKRERVGSRISLTREEALALGVWLTRIAAASEEEVATMTFMVEMQKQVEDKVGKGAP